MANERTFLAWLRTSLSFITIGIGITQLFRLNDPVDESPSPLLLYVFESKNPSIHKYGKPLGSIFVILGILTLILGANRYFTVQSMLIHNKFPATRLGILSLIVLIALIIIFTFLVILKVSRSWINVVWFTLACSKVRARALNTE